MPPRIIRIIRMVCNSCGYDEERTDADKRFDDIYNFDPEKDVCPGCLKKAAEEI